MSYYNLIGFSSKEMKNLIQVQMVDFCEPNLFAGFFYAVNTDFIKLVEMSNINYENESCWLS